MTTSAGSADTLAANYKRRFGPDMALRVRMGQLLCRRYFGQQTFVAAVPRTDSE